MAACQQLHEARHALLSRVLSDWPSERVETFAGLFADFNSSVETLLRASTATPRENA